MKSPKAFSKYLSQYRDLVLASNKRKASRSQLRHILGKGHIDALKTPEYQKLLASHAKQYGKEVVQDVAHPIDTFKRQLEMVKHKVTPAGEIIKRSPVDQGITASYLFGIPLLSGASMITDKEYPPTERTVKAVGYALPPLLTPKILPSLAASYIPDIAYHKKKDKSIDKDIATQMKDMRRYLLAKRNMERWI